VLGRWPGCVPGGRFESLDASRFAPKPDASQEDPAAIIFTTGSTGPPKGVLYRHRNFIQQATQIRDYFDLRPGSVDVSGFPLFALFNTAMGTTTVFPQMDATRPADVYPPNVIDAVNQFGADQSFGSPALWNTVSTWCVENNVQIPGLRRILSAGAPVPPDVLQRVCGIIAADGDAFTPYGATEALPVACNSATVVLNETAAKTQAGHGTCVGQKFQRIDWQVIEISDQPLTDVSQTKPVAAGQIGELMVRGPAVTDQYVTRVAANADHKVHDGDTFWHRMGDVGYLDDQNRFWFCGRKNHRVLTQAGTLYTICCEGIINSHPHVYRSALVGVNKKPDGTRTPVVVIEPHAGHWPESEGQRQQFLNELQELARGNWVTETIETFLFRKALPVDIRHNSKIFREQLGPWAEQQL
jgi:acyl-CoA synthetase (AMP-forming)/AMP-acid ligase II